MVELCKHFPCADCSTTTNNLDVLIGNCAKCWLYESSEENSDNNYYKKDTSTIVDVMKEAHKVLDSDITPPCKSGNFLYVDYNGKGLVLNTDYIVSIKPLDKNTTEVSVTTNTRGETYSLDYPFEVLVGLFI